MISPGAADCAQRPIVPSSPRTTSTGSPGDFRRQAIARLGHLFDPATQIQLRLKHFGLLEGEKLRRGIAAGRHHPFLRRRDVERGDLCQQSLTTGGRDFAAPLRLAVNVPYVSPGNHSLPNEVRRIHTSRPESLSAA